MKEQIIERIVRGVVFGALLMFGLRGVLPDISAAGNLPVLFIGGAVTILGSAVGPYVYEMYRCAYRCDATCKPEFCRAT